MSDLYSKSDDLRVNLLYLKQDGVHFIPCPKQGNNIEGVVCPKQGQGF